MRERHGDLDPVFTSRRMYEFGGYADMVTTRLSHLSEALVSLQIPAIQRRWNLLGLAAARRLSNNFPPHLLAPSNDSPPGGKGGLKLSLGVCFGFLAVILIVALFTACATKLQRPPRFSTFLSV